MAEEAVGGAAPPPPAYLADYAHLAICTNGATEKDRDEAIARPRLVVLGVWDRASPDDNDADDLWMGAPQGVPGVVGYLWSAAESAVYEDEHGDIYWDRAPIARRKRVRVEQHSSSPSPPLPPPVIVVPPPSVVAEEKKRRARPEQNLYNDHKAALRALDRQLRNDPGDVARLQFIREEVDRRKRAADDYAAELAMLRADAKARSAREKRRFSMRELHDEFAVLTTQVGKRHGLRHLDTGALLFVQ